MLKPAQGSGWAKLGGSGNERKAVEERAGHFLVCLAVRCETCTAILHLQNHQVSPVPNFKHLVFKIQKQNSIRQQIFCTFYMKSMAQQKNLKKNPYMMSSRKLLHAERKAQMSTLPTVERSRHKKLSAY